MLWFRTGAVVALTATSLFSVSVGCSTFLMCVSPANARAMNMDPYYNGSLFFYVLVIIAELGMSSATLFGFIVAFRVWRNNHQMDHRLRHLFTLWLAALGLAIVFIFILGIIGLVRYREPQEEIISLYEIFAKYNQDIKFVGSFERYQRENSCCGINGPNDWMMAQLKTGGGETSMGGYGGYSSYDSSFMGSPSTGKCHLTPPTIPMGCGKKLLEEIHFTMMLYCVALILETLCSVAAAILGWYCFFYWIEKEVIIIPEDEVSNLIVIEPESSTSTVTSSVVESIPSGWSGSVMYSGNGSQYTMLSRPENNNESRYTRGSVYSSNNSYRSNNTRLSDNSFRASNYLYPNSRRTLSRSNVTKFSNFYGSVPSIGGPHVSYYPPTLADTAEVVNSNMMMDPYSLSIPFRQDHSRSNFRSQAASLGPYPPRQFTFKTLRDISRHELAESNRWNNDPHPYGTSIHHYGHEGSVIRKKSKAPKKKHSFNHMLHKQEKALGGRVLAEMHVDHSRDPDPINSNMDVGKANRGHRAHHATIAIIKNKTQKKPKKLINGPEAGHGQTGHLAEDILEMSGAPAVKSLIDDLALPVEHDPHIMEGGGYVKKLHKAHKKKGQLDHPDSAHPRHGPVHDVNGMVSAPSIDGSQAQSLMDNVLKAKPKPKLKAPIIKAHGAMDPITSNHGTAIPSHHRHHHGEHEHAHDHRQIHHQSRKSLKTEILYKSNKLID